MSWYWKGSELSDPFLFVRIRLKSGSKLSSCNLCFILAISKFKSMVFFLFGLSGGEIFVVVMLFLLLFGGKRIPEMAKTIGLGMREFKKATNQIRDEIELSTVERIDDVEVLKDLPQSQSFQSDVSNDKKITSSDYHAGEGI